MCAVLGSQGGENQDMGVRAELSVFDRNSDPGLNELTELAAVLCNADYAYLGWMDYNRLWFRSRYGFRASDQPRAATACQWMLDKGQPLLIADASQDPRFPPDRHSAAQRRSLPFLCREFRCFPVTCRSSAR